MEKKKKVKLLLAILAVIVLVALAGAGTAYYLLLAPQFHPEKTQYVYIDRDDTADSVYHKVQQAGHPGHLAGFRWMARYRHYDQCLHTGRYAIHPGESVYQVFSRLYRGYQEPMNLTIGSVRTLDRLARSVGEQLMIDSAEIAAPLSDTAFVHRLGYTPATLPALFIPNTYQVYWNMSVEEFFRRMQREHDAFWNEKRLAQADALHMTPEEVATLASIVEEETNIYKEYPIVAGLYINRLKRGMLLQADPTVKYAVGDFSLRRILNVHLETESPYNTYLHPGLPPGPIRIPSARAIDAVLNYQHHRYLYMVAKETLDGSHNFATNLRDHTNNAIRYQRALNRMRIYR